jgi:hypothetical protein
MIAAWQKFTSDFFWFQNLFTASFIKRKKEEGLLRGLPAL